MTADAGHSDIDGPRAWFRLAVLLALATIGNVGMWSIVVTLPAVQTEFGLDRGEASLPYTLTMIGFGIGGLVLGRATDRIGTATTIAFAAAMLGTGYVVASQAGVFWLYAVVHGVLIGLLGSAAMFAPLMADASHWFLRRRGLAVSICASGNYVAGTVWPPAVEYVTRLNGWRTAELGIGLFCAATMLPLTLLLRRKRPEAGTMRSVDARADVRTRFGMPLGALQGLLVLAGVACCVAMSMPQVHLVAYCGDLGYGVARGADMLALMMACGIVSRIASGWIADRIGGLATLLGGSLLQSLMLAHYLPFTGLASLYVISALFGLVQGGIIPSYAIIVREVFSAREAGTRVGTVIMATVFGMALGGWVSGAIFDLTGSYRDAFANGVAWNVLNLGVVMTLLLRDRGRREVAVA
ncbi:MAG TPA: MFS transporter [Acidisphaera sp.]|nr:MFS transporter [Acidisphaera sp.]